MSGVPDYPLEETIDFKFTTRAFATGIPTTLAGTPVVDIYEDNSLTQITAAETLTVDFDGVTGLNNLRVVATAANGFGSGQSYHAVITTGTVGGVSVVGEVVQQFTIERSPALRPTTAGRTLDVTAAGEAGLDLDNTVGTLAAAQIATGAITAAKFAAGAIDAAAIAANAIGASELAADAVGASQLATDAVNEIRDAILSDSTSFAGANIDAAISSRAVPRDCGLLQSTTIATLASQVSFTLTAGSADNDAYNGAIAVITDVSTATQKAVGLISDYVGATRTVTLASDPGIFTMAATDLIDIIAVPKQLPDIEHDAAGGLPTGDGNGRVDVGEWIGTAVTLGSGAPDVNIQSIDANAITAASIATDALTAAKIAADAIGASELATDAVNEIRDAILSDSTAFQGADIAAILTDTGTSGVQIDMAQTLPASPTDDTTGDALKQASRIPEGIRKNTILDDFEFVMYDTTDHITPITGRTVSGTRSIDGAAFAAVGGSFAEVGNGVYQFDALAADTNGDLITWRFTAAGADDVFITFKTTP